jgi:NAD(P)-dependent dehydrogenase (short-subunit alcohol dehydrogenase family)
VVLTDLDREELERQTRRLGPKAASFVLDVADRLAWPEARRFAEAWGGPVSILVNNAGIGPDLRPLTDMSGEGFDLLLRIKLNGSFNGVSTFAPGMRARGEGHIVNTASMAGLTAAARLGAYTTAMFGLVGMSEVLRAELEPYGVGVSVLCPGRTESRLTETTRSIIGEAHPPMQDTDVLPMPASPSKGMIPSRAVGDMVVEAIRANDLYILTHGEYAQIVEQRCRRLAAAFQRSPRRDGDIPAPSD